MTTKTELLQIVRAKCIECSGGELASVRTCHIERCVLWPFRMAVDPSPARGGRRPGMAAAAQDDGQPDEQQEWRDYDPHC